MLIVNVKLVGWDGLEAICGQYVGRPSVLGNPFVIGRHVSREQVIELYRKWLYQQLVTGNQAVQHAIEQLQDDSILGCWCHPEACHAAVIESAWHWWMSEGKAIYGGKS